MSELKTFQLTVINQVRVIICLLLIPIIIIIPIIIVSLTHYLLFGLLSFLILPYLMYYYSIGNLTVSSDKDTLTFNWKRKYLFNYKNIDPIAISKIKSIVIEEGRFLRKITSENRTVSISTSNYNPKDSFKLIAFFSNLSKEYDFKLINSYKSLQKKDYTKTMYKVNNLIIAVAIILIIIIIIQKGFSSKIFFLLGPLFTLLFYRNKMKSDLGKK